MNTCVTQFRWIFLNATEYHLKVLEESFKVRYHFVVFGSTYASNDPVTLGPLKWRRTTFLRVSSRRNRVVRANEAALSLFCLPCTLWCPSNRKIIRLDLFLAIRVVNRKPSNSLSVKLEELILTGQYFVSNCRIRGWNRAANGLKLFMAFIWIQWHPIWPYSLSIAQDTGHIETAVSSGVR